MVSTMTPRVLVKILLARGYFIRKSTYSTKTPQTLHRCHLQPLNGNFSKKGSCFHSLKCYITERKLTLVAQVYLFTCLRAICVLYDSSLCFVVVFSELKCVFKLPFQIQMSYFDVFQAASALLLRLHHRKCGGVHHSMPERLAPPNGRV